MRWLVLYLRSRSVPLAAAVTIGATAVLWWLTLIVTNPATPAKLTLLATMLGAITIGPGLAGADHDLDRTAAIAWPVRRAIHIAVAAGAVTAILSATALTGHPLNQAGPISRNVIGLTGLVALGATTVGPSRAWLPPLIWTALLLRYTPPFGTSPRHPAPLQMLTWLMQPAGTTSATIAAVMLGVAGTASYAILGPRRSTHAPSTDGTPAR
jgi:hypothetical protein